MNVLIKAKFLGGSLYFEGAAKKRFEQLTRLYDNREFLINFIEISSRNSQPVIDYIRTIVLPQIATQTGDESFSELEDNLLLAYGIKGLPLDEYSMDQAMHLIYALKANFNLT